MEVFFFLAILASAFIAFATIQDLKTREVANWLNFSLLAFALLYRLNYSLVNDEWMVLFWGVAGTAAFYLLGLGFYYGKVFAGGDAKLLIGIGAILPFSDLQSFLSYSGLFILALFASGAIVSLIFGAVLVIKNPKRFGKEFLTLYSKSKGKIWISQFIGLVILVIVLYADKFVSYSLVPFVGVMILAIVMPWLAIALLALEKGCLVRKLEPQELSEGDWLTRQIRVKGRVIKKTVHGLSAQDIIFLKKNKISVEIKQGIPFVPAFFLPGHLWYSSFYF